MGGVLDFGMLSDLTDLEPHVGIRDHNDTINIVWETMTSYDTSLEPQGFLTESWEVNDDATEFVFHVRPGVPWHPYKGATRDVTAQDIAYNWDRVAAPDTAFAQLRANALLYDGWEAPDDSTFILRSSVPRPTTFDGLQSQRIGHPESLDAKASGEAGIAIGTGPFLLGEWRPGDQFNLLKFADYWQGDRPYLDEIIFHVSLDAQTAVSQLESGAIHVFNNPPIRDFVRWRDEDSQQSIVHQSPGSYHAAGYLTTYAPLNDKRARQAMQWAIDRQRFADIVLLETVEPWSLPWPEASIAYDAAKKDHYSFDLDKAQALFEEAGVTGGFSGGFIMNPNTLELIEFAEIYQSDLAKIGVDFEIEVVEVANFVERINGDPPNFNGVWLSGSSRTNLGAPITMVNSTNVLFGINQLDVKGPNGEILGDNNTAYWSQEWTDIVNEINLENDPETLKDLYQTMNDILLEDSWIAFLAPRPSRVGVAKEVLGVYDKPADDGFLYDLAYFA
jgi:peptide/nickel transport system substrate-binding protein